MNTVIAVLIIVAVGAGIVWYMRKHPKTSSAPATATGSPKKGNLDPELADLYAIGMNPGDDGTLVMYALETCRHCRKTREFLDSNNIKYHLIYVDQFNGEERANLMDKIRSYNPRGSFPTVMLPNGKVIVGYREQLLREALLDDTPGTA